MPKKDKAHQKHTENRKKQQLILEMQAYALTIENESKRVMLKAEKFGKNLITIKK